MEDTTREVRAIQQRIWMSLPEEERFRRCGEMFELAKAFAIKRAPKDLNEKDMVRFVVMEFYGLQLPTDHLAKQDDLPNKK